jgi:hypothetical protein
MYTTHHKDLRGTQACHIGLSITFTVVATHRGQDIRRLGQCQSRTAFHECEVFLAPSQWG